MNLLEFINMSGESPNPASSAQKALGNLYTISSEAILPISVESSDWLTFSDPERLVKNFIFKKFDHLSYFVNEILKYQERFQHHAKLTIDQNSIRIETYTHNVNSVTKQDFNLAKFCDEIYDDVRFLNYGEYSG